MEYELYHHGVKNMKWGIRRYQNKDGSLTPAGIKRYNKEVQKLKNREASIKNREQAKKYQDKLDKKKAELDEREAALKGKASTKSAPKKNNDDPGTGAPRKSIKDMSNKELQDFVDRVALEKKYRDALASTLPPAKVSKGREFVNKVLNEVVGPAAKEVGKSVVKSLLTDAANKAFELDTGNNKGNNKGKKKEDEDD